MKLYKATDKLDGALSMFLVDDEGRCAVSFYDGNDEWEIESHKDCASILIGPNTGTERFADAIDPVLLAEW